MSENWQPGDIAECILDCNFRHPDCKLAAQVPSIYFAIAPRMGDRFVVEAVRLVQLPPEYPEGQQVYLSLRGTPGNCEYHAGAFRKVTPPREMIEQERREVVKA